MTSTELMNVAAFDNVLPDAAYAALNPAAESLSDGIGAAGYGIIGFKGKDWSLKKAGETKYFGTPTIDVIIIRSPDYKSKSYYEGGYAEGLSAGKRPDCASLHGVQPDGDVTKPQNATCGLCPHNEFKMQKNGKKGKACTDYKRLAVLLLPSVTEAMLGEALIEPVLLRIPPASLTDLGLMGDAMSRKGFHYSSYITRIGFVPGLSHPKLTFTAIQKLTAAEAPVVLPMREDPLSYRITGERDYATSTALDTSATARIEQQTISTGLVGGGGQSVGVPSEPATKAANVVAFTPKKEEVVEEDEITRLKRQLAEAMAAKSAPMIEATAVVGAAPSSPGPAASVASTPAEPADESDGELDDLVNALLPR